MIYLKLNKPPDTISDLFDKLFTYNFYGTYKACETYSDVECTIRQCMNNRYRSADDIVEIVQTYFPSATEKEIFKELLYFNTLRNGTYYATCLIHCPDIRKPTVCLRRGTSPSLNDVFYSERMTQSKYKDWKTICKLAGITSKRKLEQINREE